MADARMADAARDTAAATAPPGTPNPAGEVAARVHACALSPGQNSRRTQRAALRHRLPITGRTGEPAIGS
jgi:hypothetical protein